MRSEIILCKYKGKTIVPEFLQKAVNTHATAAGIAVVKDGGVVIKSFDPGELEKDKLTLFEVLNKTQEFYKDEQLYIHLTQADETEFSFDSLQPFPILTSGDKVLLAVMLDGDFKTVCPQPGEDTPSFVMVRDYLKNKIVEAYKEAGNLEKCIAKMDGPSFRADIKPHLEPHGVLLQIPARGKTFAYSNNKLGGVFDWGFATRTLGFEPMKEVKEPEKPVVEVSNRPLTLREKQERKAALAASQGQPAAPPAAPEPSNEGVKIEEKKPEPNTPFYEVEGVKWARPAKNSSLKEIRNFWSRNTALPYPKDAMEALAGFPAAAARMNSPIFDAMTREEKESTTAFRDAMEKAREKKSKEATTAADTLPGILTAAEKQTAVNLRKNEKLWGLTPEQMIELTKPDLFYSDQVQIPFEDFKRASMNLGMLLGKRDLTLLWHETRIRLIQTEEKLTRALAGATVTQQEETKEPFVAPKKMLTLREKRELKEKAA